MRMHLQAVDWLDRQPDSTLTLPHCKQLQFEKEVFTALCNEQRTLQITQCDCDLSSFAMARVTLLWRDPDLLGFGWAHRYHPCHIMSSLDPKKP